MKRNDPSTWIMCYFPKCSIFLALSHYIASSVVFEVGFVFVGLKGREVNRMSSHFDPRTAMIPRDMRVLYVGPDIR